MFKTRLKTAALAVAVTVATAGTSFATGWTTSGVNFRSGPGTNYGVIGWIDRCSRVNLGYTQGGWYRVTWSGRQGWVASRYITQRQSYCRGGGSNY